MTSHGSTQLWFPIADLLPLADRCQTAYRHDPDPEHGPIAVLHLTSQGDELFYLSCNALPALLVDAFDPASTQRVYALGYGHDIGGLTYPADVDRYGPPVLLASIPVNTGPLGRLADRLHHAARIGCDWFVLVLHPDGRLEPSMRSMPHPAPPARWRYARLELACLPGVWPGQFVDNATHDGWLLPRFSQEIAQQIAATIADMAAAGPLPYPLSLIELTDTPAARLPATGPSRLVGPDLDGYFRVGPGWPWVSLDLLPDGLLMPYPGPTEPDIDPAQLPAPGQPAFTGLGYLMWLDHHLNLALRTIDDGHVDPADEPGIPEYGNLDPDVEWQLRAVEHVLRKATAGPPRTGIAAEFTADEVEALIITAADVTAGAGVESLSRRQFELAHRAYALLFAAADAAADDLAEGGDRS